LYNIHNLSGVWRFHGDQCFYHTNVHNQTSLNFPPTFLALRGCHVCNYFA
jgi:hypothetical protein